MTSFQKRAPLLFIVVSFLLLQAACVPGATASSVSTSSSSSLVKHGETTAAAVHVRKLLTITTVQAAAAAAMSAGTPAPEKTTAAEAEAAPSECSEEAVQVTQCPDQQEGGGYTVTIANTCVQCTVRDVHISCGEFCVAKLAVSPADFRRVAVGDCLVRGGGALGPGESVSFRYSSLFQYHFDVASVSCS